MQENINNRLRRGGRGGGSGRDDCVVHDGRGPCFCGPTSILVRCARVLKIWLTNANKMRTYWSFKKTTLVPVLFCNVNVEQPAVYSITIGPGSPSSAPPVAPRGRGWCRGTARGEPGSGGHDPHRHTGLVSPRATGIAPTLGVGPCGACNPAWRRAAAAGGPARGGGYVERRALPRSHATGRHVPPRQAGAPGPDSPSSLLTALGDLYCIVLRCIGWSAARANSH